MLFFHDILGQVFLSSFIWLTAAAVASEGFTNPPPPRDIPDLTYNTGSILQVTWRTNLKRIALILIHGTERDLTLEYLPDSRDLANTNSYVWSVGAVIDPYGYPASLGDDLHLSEKIFYLAIFDNENDGQDLNGTFRSNSFRVVAVDPFSAFTNATVSSSSGSTFLAAVSTVISPALSITNSTQSLNITTASPALSITTSTQSISPTTTSPAPSITTSTQLLNPASSSAIAINPGISQSTKIGIGVGIGIGGPLLLAMGIYLGWKCHRRRTPPNSSNDDALSTSRAANFQRALEELSGPRINNHSYQANRDLEIR